MQHSSQLLARHPLRQRRIVTSRDDCRYMLGQQPMINFAGNDYLGLAQHERVKAAFIAGVNEYGFGSGSSPMVSGYTRAHQRLEDHFAQFVGRERALLFNSGYHANLAVISSFANRHTNVIADKHIHASMIDAIQLSDAPHHRYRHHDHVHAEQLLQQHASENTLLIIESVFSMSGAVTNAEQLSTLANQYNASLIIDDAHGIGILGATGRGVSEQFSLTSRYLPILISPLGKAIAGMGAMVSGDNDVIEYLLQHARTYTYSTALPPAVCRAAEAVLDIIENDYEHIQKLRHIIQFFHEHAARHNLSFLSTDMTPIKCMLTGSNENTIALQEKLLAHGLFVAAIRPPTVPANTARIRISLSASHSENDITLLLDILAEAHEKSAA